MIPNFIPDSCKHPKTQRVNESSFGTLDPVLEEKRRIKKNLLSLQQINDAKKKVSERNERVNCRYPSDKQMCSNDLTLRHPIGDYRLVRKIKWDINSPRFKAA